MALEYKGEALAEPVYLRAWSSLVYLHPKEGALEKPKGVVSGEEKGLESLSYFQHLIRGMPSVEIQ